MSIRKQFTKTASAWLQAGFVVAVMLGMASVAAPAHADPVNLVQNGDFSATSLTGTGGYLCANTGGSSCASNLTGWQGSCSSIGCVGSSTPGSLLFAGTNGSAWNGNRGLYWNGIGDAPPGGNTVAIDGDPKYTSTISQAIAGLQLGHSYTLQFYQAASQQIGLSGATTEQWRVNLGDSIQTSTLMNTASQGAHGWMVQTMTFVATAVSETLQFVALGTPGGEPPVCLLGDVSLLDGTPVPEPATIAMVAAGLLVLAVGRRKTKQG